MLARMAARWYTRLSAVFNDQLKNRQVVVLYGSGEQFRQTNVVDEDLGEGAGGDRGVQAAYRVIDYVHPFDRPQAAQAMDVGVTPPTGLLSWRWLDTGEGKIW
jgi:hypothetical protein